MPKAVGGTALKGKRTSGSSVTAMHTYLGSMAGALETPVFAPRGTVPLGFTYKIAGKVFAVLNVRGQGYVTLKCEPEIIAFLRDTYAGVGKRTHLDPRHWISVMFEADVPLREIRRLAAGSYALVCAGLTRQQKAQLQSSEV